MALSFDSVTSIIGAVVPVLSAIASFVNHIVRVQIGEGKEPNKAMLAFASLLNVGALNVDKSVQLAKMARGLGAIKDEEPKDAP